MPFDLQDGPQNNIDDAPRPMDPSMVGPMSDSLDALRIIKTILWIVATLLLVLIVLVVMFSFDVSIEESHSAIVPVNKTLYKESYASISIANYTNISKDFNSKVSILGFLYEVHIPIDNTSTRVYKYIVDDYGNKIRLVFGSYASREYDALFTENKTTNESYLIYGTLTNKYLEPTLDVDNMSITQRKLVTTEYSSIVNESVTINTTRQGSFNLSAGFSRLLMMG